jgi:hypothetical protein
LNVSKERITEDVTFLLEAVSCLSVSRVIPVGECENAWIHREKSIFKAVQEPAMEGHEMWSQMVWEHLRAMVIVINLFQIIHKRFESCQGERRQRTLIATRVFESTCAKQCQIIQVPGQIRLVGNSTFLGRSAF